MKQLLFIICFCFYVVLDVNAQQDSISLNGTLRLSKSDTYQYKLVAGLADGKWQGYSVLDAGGPNETKSTVVLLFSKEKKTMMFTEKLLISSKSKETSFCFVGGVLKMNEQKNEIKGFFLGQDEKKKMCGSGTVKFNLPEAVRSLMTPDGTKDTNVAAVVTKSRSGSFRVNNARVQLELWDGGVNDHDSLMVTLNNVMVIPAFEITNVKKVVTLQLKKGENILKITALNEGAEPPNSARINIIDQDQQHAVVSFLKKYEDAVVKIKL